ncbi:unnamed protein product [Heligmosomoides polygyrus]|uniref:Gag_p10 domain-containing protein n=1 Tax=Heligmosomoides polygyrus TaxID=6339 RepID=A0A183F683_HELPZ|nr:unnamed protein product [Heligmosomoides polygyrus]
MTTIGSIKITKAAKALKASMEEAEKLRTGQVPPDAPAGKSASVDPLTWSTIGNAYLHLKRRIESLEEHWERAEEFALEQAENAPGVLEEFRAHWTANACAESIQEAERLVLELGTAFRVQLERQTPSSGGLPESVKLPPFELPEFKGDMHAFPEFWEMFAVAVHDNPTVPTISKFLYLKGKLKGEAHKLISPLQFSEYNYQQAVQLLKKTYMRPDILRIQLVQELQAVPPAHDIPTSQRTTLCTLKALWVQLEKLGEHPASTAHKCTIGEKFPLRTMEKAGELVKNAGEDWTVNHLLDALDQVIDRQGHYKDSTQPWRRRTSPSSTVHARHPEPMKFQRSTPEGKS